MQVLGPISGGWWWHHHWTRLSYRKWHCSNLFLWKGNGQFPFFKVYHPSTEKPKALVGFKLRTEPELGTGDSHSTSTPQPPTWPDEEFYKDFQLFEKGPKAHSRYQAIKVVDSHQSTRSLSIPYFYTWTTSYSLHCNEYTSLIPRLRLQCTGTVLQCTSKSWTFIHIPV